MPKRSSRPPLVKMRASVNRIQGQAERLVGRVQREARALIARSRAEVLKDVRDLERRVVKGFHAATAEQVARLERRVAKLEQLVAELPRKTEEAA